jgi:hypothetical protein
VGDSLTHLLMLLPHASRATLAWYRCHRAACVVAHRIKMAAVFAYFVYVHPDSTFESRVAWMLQPLGFLRYAWLKVSRPASHVLPGGAHLPAHTHTAIPVCLPLQAASVFMLNTCIIASFESTAWVILLFYMPAVVLAALPDCMRTQPGELETYARAARRLRPWLYALSPMPVVDLGRPAKHPTPLEGLQACVVWNVWLPALVGGVLPVALLAATQLSWRRDFLAQRAARRQGPAPPPVLIGVWSPAHVCGLLLAFSCILWILVEAAVLHFLVD